MSISKLEMRKYEYNYNRNMIECSNKQINYYGYSDELFGVVGI